MKHAPIERLESNAARSWLGALGLATLSLATLSLATLSATACGERDLHELGFTAAPPEDSVDAAPVSIPDAMPMAPFSGAITAFEGRWVGAADDPVALELATTSDETIPAFRFPSGSTRIALEADDQGVFFLTFGDGQAPPPAEDPDVGYPTNVDYWDVFTYFDDQDVLARLDRRPLPPFEGVTYRGTKANPRSEEHDSSPGSTADGVLRIGFSTIDVLQDWCGMQAPVARAPGEYSCLPGDGSFVGWPDQGPCMTGDGIDDVCATGELCDIPSVPVDCNKALLCVQERCVCNDTSCFAAEETSQELILRRTATGLTGAFNNTLFLNERGLLISLGTVRFRAAD